MFNTNIPAYGVMILLALVTNVNLVTAIFENLLDIGVPTTLPTKTTLSLSDEKSEKKFACSLVFIFGNVIIKIVKMQKRVREVTKW